MPAQVAIITGAASGIGLATARLFAEMGYQVVSCDLQFAPDPLPERWCTHLIADVRQVEQLQNLVEVARECGQIQCLVNNAGTGMVKPVSEVTEEDWDLCLNTNLKAAFFATQAVVAEMQQGGGGSIINVASNASLLPRSHDPVYSISKQALWGLTKSLALCLSGNKIRVNAVCPGPVSDTGMINQDLAKAADPEAAQRQFINASPLAAAYHRMITPAEVAQAIYYLASDAAALVTGTAIAIDGGKSLGVPPQFAAQ